MAIILFLIPFAIAVIDWVAVWKSWRKLEYFAKPAVMLALLGWIAAFGGFRGPMLWIVLGVIFSLAGDVFLVLPRERFILGLVAFLLAHVFYLVGFSVYGPLSNAPVAILAVIILITSSRLYLRLSEGLQRSGLEKLRTPVLIYSIVISLMLLSALATLVRPDWRFSAAALSAVGGLLFYVSDALLAWNRFLAPLPRSRVVSMMAYHLGQFGIVLGASIQFIFT
ncbi:MAG: lysoplasmalogenase [Anaerolineae bacterium]|nr:lysoplasmalogenase [Anaerolineae bacterium]MCZ7551273.1 lysoplasmalogenase [Anaerolineales bacterium]